MRAGTAASKNVNSDLLELSKNFKLDRGVLHCATWTANTRQAELYTTWAGKGRQLDLQPEHFEMRPKKNERARSSSLRREMKSLSLEGFYSVN